MNDPIESSILQFLKEETLQGRIEATAREIANGANLVYNQVGRALERLIMKDQVGYRERGTERKPVRYYYLKDILELCRERWEA
jgi:transcription initiation factor IIE alpha subunit